MVLVLVLSCSISTTKFSTTRSTTTTATDTIRSSNEYVNLVGIQNQAGNVNAMAQYYDTHLIQSQPSSSDYADFSQFRQSPPQSKQQRVGVGGGISTQHQMPLNQMAGAEIFTPQAPHKQALDVEPSGYTNTYNLGIPSPQTKNTSGCTSQQHSAQPLHHHSQQEQAEHSESSPKRHGNKLSRICNGTIQLTSNASNSKANSNNYVQCKTTKSLNIGSMDDGNGKRNHRDKPPMMMKGQSSIYTNDATDSTTKDTHTHSKLSCLGVFKIRQIYM